DLREDVLADGWRQDQDTPFRRPRGHQATQRHDRTPHPQPRDARVEEEPKRGLLATVALEPDDRRVQVLEDAEADRRRADGFTRRRVEVERRGEPPEGASVPRHADL